MRSIEDILRTACDHLNSRDMEYVIVGGMAVIAYGRPRATSDIDIIIQMVPDDICAFVKFLRENGFYADPNEALVLLKEGSHFTAQDKETLFRLDIKTVKGEMDLRTLKNRRSIDYHGIHLYLASPEDTIANKLYFGAPQDIADAESIFIRLLSELDMRYLEKTCKSMRLGNEFKRLRAKIDRTEKESKTR